MFIKCIHIFNEIVEYPGLYRNQDDFRFLKTNIFFIIQKILYFVSISVKCISRQIFNEIVEN